MTAESPAPVLEFNEVFEVVGKLALEENANVVTADLGMVADPLGGVLIVDMRSAQFRRYDTAGRLLWNFGRAGPGPEEFSMATAITRVSDHQVFAVDRQRKGVLWNERTKRADRVITSDAMGKVLGIEHLGGDRVIVEGPATVNNQPTLKVLDLSTGDVTARFFAPYQSPFVEHSVALGIADVMTAVRADTIAALFSYSDSLYTLDSSGRPLEKIVLPSSRRRIPTETYEDMGSQAAWARHFDSARKFFWMPTGDFVFTYQRTIRQATVEGIKNGDFGEYEHAILGIRRNGSGMFETFDFRGMLKGVDAAGNFYFDDPDSMFPNQLIVARLKVR